MTEEPVYKKLLIKPGNDVHLVNAPPGAETILGELPEDASIDPLQAEPPDVKIVFTRSRQEMEEILPSHSAAIDPDTILWVAYPKGSSKLKSDIHRDILREFGETIGLKAVTLVSLDDDWSAMRFKRVE